MTVTHREDVDRLHIGSVQTAALDIVAAGGVAEAAEVDALDEEAVERHAAGVVEKTGGIDVHLDVAQFLTARAAARHMMRRRKGVILTIGASPARLAIAGAAGFGVACAAIEGLSRTHAAELGP